MTVFPRFSEPWALLLLLFVPLTIWAGTKIRSLGPGRKWFVIMMRSLILSSLIAALAGAEIVRITDRLAVFFLLDRSDSIPEGARTEAAEAVRVMCETFMTTRDEAGVIAFGGEASIELAVAPSMELGEIQSFIDGEQTDVAAAVRLALAAFPQGYMKRIVLLTDGNETQGAALEEVKLAQASGAAVDVIPLEIAGVNEVRLREVVAPARANADEPFKLQVVVKADQDCEATLRVYQRLGSGKRLMQAQPVTLQKGENAFALRQELDTPGFYEYEATIECDSDTVMANNEGRAFSLIHGEPSVLYVDTEPSQSTYLEPALQAEGIRVVRGGLESIPGSLAQFQLYDAVVLANVSATDLTIEQIKSLEAVVRDLGIGLVMIGGSESFGAGGYHDSAVERALPVRMDIKQRKIMPRGALVLVMHTCEIPDGNAWSRDIGIAALNVLSSQDLMGALAYNYPDGDGWVYKLQPVGSKHMMRRALNTPNIGDMPDVQPTLQMAYDALVDADAMVKRVIMTSDGDPAAPSTGLLTKFADAGIPVSTVCVSPHRPNDQQMLRWVADMTGGKFYLVTNPYNLPQIFTKEAAVVKRSLLYEKPFIPLPQHGSELLRGAIEEGFPPLQGYVVTSAKDNATLALVSPQGDPVLAHWRYGLGKSVAFTSDVTTRWAPDWVSWDGFGRFWAQAVRWAVRDLSPSSFRIDTRVRDGMGYVKIDAVDDQGRFVNFLRPRAVVSGPPPDFAQTQVDLLQTGPGIYEARFPVREKGIYMLNMVCTMPDGSERMIPAGLSLNYSKEYEYNTTNRALLEQLVDVSGGNLLTATDNPFQHDLETTPTITPIWQFLVAFSACLFPIEIFTRRVVFSLHPLWAWSAKVLRAVPGVKRLIRPPKQKRGRVTGIYGGMARPSRGRVYTAASTELPASSAGRGPGEDDDLAPGLSEHADEPAAPAAPGHSEYTRQLLAAKERALKQRGRRTKE